MIEKGKGKVFKFLVGIRTRQCYRFTVYLSH